ncbi:hypothetical protein [Herbiconiux ginsengi]|uniref:hypothetical protein n=1 Tax=Herbiconiux ginsengi TaxID=381665 RepID=UPI001114F23B|nr:hypothetical protein [Herbiconiux ginsengi]
MTYLTAADWLGVRATHSALIFPPGTPVETARHAVRYLSRRDIVLLLCFAAVPLLFGAIMIPGVISSPLVALSLSGCIAGIVAVFLILALRGRSVPKLLRQSLRLRLSAPRATTGSMSLEALVREIERLRQVSIISASGPVSDEVLWGRVWAASHNVASR